MTLNLPAARGNLSPAERRAAILEKAQARMKDGGAPSRRTTGVTYLGLNGNTGALTIGRERVEWPADQKAVVVFDTCRHGWQYWEAKRPTDELSTPILEGARPATPEGMLKGESPDPKKSRDGWSEFNTVTMSGMGGELDGIVIKFDLSNQSGLGASDDLFAEMFDNVATPHGQRGLLNPIITISVGSYRNESHDKDVFFPVFEISGWTDGDEILDIGADAAAANLLT